MGEVFAGRYELLDQIGEGGMGTVWRVRDLRTDTVVAAKVLRHLHASSLMRFVREQAVRVHHPHVVVPLGWAGEDDLVLFTMPLVAGGSLADLVGDFGALPPRLCAEILRQLLAAVAAVHAARLVHRDIKPANVLLAATGTGRPHAYLSDFGVAYDLDGPRLTEVGMITGTRGYLAPELVRGGEPSPASDIYATGMVALTMLTGMRPEPGEVIGAVPPGVPVVLWDVVRDLTAPSPGSRPQPAEALERLASPELTWTPDAIGEVEVFNHLPAPSAGPGEFTAEIPTLTQAEHRGGGVEESTGQVPALAAPVETASLGRPGRGRDLLIYGVFAVMIALGVLLMVLNL